MSWYSRFTRFGDTHLVYAQEQKNSCGIACVMMCVFKIRKLTPGAKAVHEEKKIYDVYSSVAGSSYDGKQYSTARNLAKTLNKLNVGTWEARYVGPNAVSQSIVDSLGYDIPGQSLIGGAPIYASNQLKPIRPIILLIAWSTAGAHFVVVDTVNWTPFGMYASVCDPWDGNVHITKFEIGKSFDYRGAPVPMSWDFGGTRHDYSSESSGSPRGWIVRQI